MHGSYPIAPGLASTNLIRRPLRDLLIRLPSLPVKPTGEPDYADADPDRLVELAESAELVLQLMHDGLTAIGLLFVCSAQQIASGDVKATHAAAIGRLQVELGEALVFIQTLPVECRRHTADYVAKPEKSHDKR
jgi:hypothetical protein